MILHELLILDKTDSVFNPIWRQGCYALPFANRLGAVNSSYGWSLSISEINNVWSYEAVSISHIVLSGLLILASQWHWVYSELDIFVSSISGNLVLDLSRIFGIHLSLASITCFTYGLLHLSGLSGPGMWTSDAYGTITSHHIVAGFLGLLVGTWHISTRIIQCIRYGNLLA